MNQEQVFGQVVEILRPFAKDSQALAQATMETNILKDLKVNSARLVDVVLELEDLFELEIADHEADQVRTVGDAVALIVRRKAA